MAESEQPHRFNVGPSEPQAPVEIVQNPIMLQIRQRVQSFSRKPDMYRRRPAGSADITTELGVNIPDWAELRRRREFEMLQQFGATAGRSDHAVRPITKTIRTHKGKGSGRQYTSKYRGVHQTFPTRRWEAQFRRNGKPTSLGCFDREDEAARAYDKMMLWCELHNAVGVKGGVTNFDPNNYDSDIHWLQQVTQDELVQILRSDGRRQAAARLRGQKKEYPGVGPAAGMAAMKEKEAAMAAAHGLGLSGGEGGSLAPSSMAPTSGAPSATVSSEHMQE